MVVFDLLKSKLISRKFWVIAKFSNYPTVLYVLFEKNCSDLINWAWIKLATLTIAGKEIFFNHETLSFKDFFCLFIMISHQENMWPHLNAMYQIKVCNKKCQLYLNDILKISKQISNLYVFRKNLTNWQIGKKFQQTEESITLLFDIKVLGSYKLSMSWLYAKSEL